MAAAEIGSFPPGVKRFFLLGAPIIALIIYWILPNTYTDIHNQVLPFNPHAKACLAVVVWMVLWWLFEPVPIPVTSLLPIPLFPLLGIAKPAQAMAPYASGTIFLFMGGFILAIAVQRWRLDCFNHIKTRRYQGACDCGRFPLGERCAFHVGIQHGNRGHDGSDCDGRSFLSAS